MFIQLNDQIFSVEYAVAEEAQMRIRMEKSFYTIASMAELLSSATQIKLLDENQEIVGIYGLLGLISIYSETDITFKDWLMMTLQVELVKTTEVEKLQAQLDEQKQLIQEHDNALVEIAGISAQSATSTDEQDTALIELADLITSLEARVAALEQKLNETNDSSVPVEV